MYSIMTVCVLKIDALENCDIYCTDRWKLNAYHVYVHCIIAE